MMEYFSDWMFDATLSRTISSKNAAGQTVETVQTINDGAAIKVAAYITKSVQTNSADKFALSEVGKVCLDYQAFFVRTSAGDPVVVTDTVVTPDSTWYATIGGKRYHIEGVDNVGMQNELYVFDYRKDR